MQDNGKEPHEWTSEQFAVASEGLDAFQAFYFDEVHELVNITTIFDQERQQLIDAIMVMVLEGLLPAFDELRSIRLYKDKPLPILNRKKHYENFARVLGHGYKDLWPKVAGLLGYNIGFMFQKDNRPIEVVVLNCCVTETKLTWLLSNCSTILAKSPSDRVSRSTL